MMTVTKMMKDKTQTASTTIYNLILLVFVKMTVKLQLIDDNILHLKHLN